MAYQIYMEFVNEDRGAVWDALLNDTVYETKALAEYIARKYGNTHGEYLKVKEADKSVRVKQKIDESSDYLNDGDSVFYGCAEHIMFGDAWLEANDNRSFI